MEAAYEIWEGDVENAVDVPQAFVAPVQLGLAQPSTPSDAEVVWHNQTHLPYEPWCTSCQAGKARGHYHIKVPPSEMALPIVQCDYTFWSNEGLALKSDVVVIDKDRAATSLTCYDMKTGFSLAIVFKKKGPIGYAVASVGYFLEQLGHSHLVLRGD